jgi:hypothetical protein
MTTTSNIEAKAVANPDAIVTMTLTDSQREMLSPLVRQQSRDRRGLILVSVAPHLDRGRSFFRLQAKFLSWKSANKVLKIIREADLRSAGSNPLDENNDKYGNASW